MTDEARAPHDAGARRKSVRFAGYAALFDQVDRGGDVVKRGAFIRSLTGAQSRPGEKRIPLLYGHNPLKRIGEIEVLAEDAKGLRVIAALHDWTPAARSVAAMVEAGALTGLSFGYRVQQMEQGPRGTRMLTDLDLIEISLVPTPMQPKARVHMVA